MSPPGLGVAAAVSMVGLSQCHPVQHVHLALRMPQHCNKLLEVPDGRLQLAHCKFIANLMRVSGRPIDWSETT